jgi:hypothetical protein
MSLRNYKLDEISINFTDFKAFAQTFNAFNVSNCSLWLDRGKNGDELVNALSILRLVENNPHVTQLVIEEDEDSYAIDSRMITYLSQHCCEAKRVDIATASAETVRLVMTSFPKLSTIGLHWLR